MSTRSHVEVVRTRETYLASLTNQPMWVQVLFFDPAGRLLVIDPFGTDDQQVWRAEPGESPRSAAHRCLLRRFGMNVTPGRLLAVDRITGTPEESEASGDIPGATFVFDGGRLTEEQVRTVWLARHQSVANELSRRSARRLAACLKARRIGRTLLLEDGVSVRLSIATSGGTRRPARPTAAAATPSSPPRTAASRPTRWSAGPVGDWLTGTAPSNTTTCQPCSDGTETQHSPTVARQGPHPWAESPFGPLLAAHRRQTEAAQGTPQSGQPRARRRTAGHARRPTPRALAPPPTPFPAGTGRDRGPGEHLPRVP